MSDIEGKAVQVAATECGQRQSFKAGNIGFWNLSLCSSCVPAFLRNIL